MSVNLDTVSLLVKPALGDHYDISPFLEGTGQRIIAEVAAEKYDNPVLALIGGFFYRIHREKEWVSIILYSLL